MQLIPQNLMTLLNFLSGEYRIKKFTINKPLIIEAYGATLKWLDGLIAEESLTHD